MTRSYSAALPIAYVVLRILVVLNWLLGAAILALLVALPNERWIMSASIFRQALWQTGLSWGFAPSR